MPSSQKLGTKGGVLTIGGEGIPWMKGGTCTMGMNGMMEMVVVRTLARVVVLLKEKSTLPGLVGSLTRAGIF
jgi:hypothetical protein